MTTYKLLGGNISVVSRAGMVLDVIDRDIQIGKKGKLKNKKFVLYRNKRYIVSKEKNGLFIYPWGKQV